MLLVFIVMTPEALGTGLDPDTKPTTDHQNPSSTPTSSSYGLPTPISTDGDTVAIL